MTALSKINPAMDPDLWPRGKPNGRNKRSYRVLVGEKRGTGIRNLKKQGLCTRKIFT